MNRTFFRVSRDSTILLLALMPWASSAQTPASPPPEKPKIEAKFYQESTPFAGNITRGILVAETNQFSFVVPNGFRRQVDAATKKVSLVSTSYTCAITAIIHESAVDGKVELKPEQLKEQVLARFKDARLVDEFKAFIESMSGPAFEVEWASPTGKMSTRVAFVPYPGGHIEFTVQAPTAEFRSYDQALTQLLMSFRTSPAGARLALQEYLSEL